MSVFNYVDPPNPNLICCICHAPFTSPVTTRTCFHTFCQDCILQALSHAAICPIDRTPLEVDDLGRAGGIVESLVEELLVTCPHFDSGCGATTQRQSMAHHLMEQCMWAEVECPVLGCGQRVTRSDVGKHGKEIHHDERLQEREEEERSNAKASNGGEKWDNPNREELPKLVQNEEPNKIPLLTEQNILLLHRVASLEGTVRELKREMESVRGVLGPWLRVSGANAQLRRRHQSAAASAPGPIALGVPPAPLESNSSPQITHDVLQQTHSRSSPIDTGHPISTPSSELPFGMQPSSAGGSGSSQGLRSTNGSRESFSEREGQQIERRVALQARLREFENERLQTRHNNDAFASSFPDFDRDTPRDVQYSNLGEGLRSLNNNATHGTLESTIADLEASRQRTDLGLASLEVSARRNEMSLSNLANDNLRMGEELVGLRAGMHGLRMQLCSLLMERDRERGVGPGLGNMGGMPVPMPLMMPGRGPNPMPGEPVDQTHRFGFGLSITKL